MTDIVELSLAQCAVKIAGPQVNSIILHTNGLSLTMISIFQKISLA